MSTKSHSFSDSKEGLFKQLDAPSSTKEIWLWWEQRRPLYNGICIITAIIAFAAYAFFLTHSGHLSPGEDLIEPIALMAGVIGGPIAWNLAYCLGPTVDIGCYLSSKNIYSSLLLKSGIAFSVLFLSLPALYWAFACLQNHTIT